MKYFDKNPKEGGIEISLWDYLEQSGIIDKAKKLGKTINPTHNFELLKQTRIEQYAIKKDKFVKERELNKIETKAIDKILFFKEWLYKELETVEQWLSDKYPNGDRKIIRETLSLVKDVWKNENLGRPDYIHVELGREMKNNNDETGKFRKII